MEAEAEAEAANFSKLEAEAEAEAMKKLPLPDTLDNTHQTLNFRSYALKVSIIKILKYQDNIFIKIVLSVL